MILWQGIVEQETAPTFLIKVADHTNSWSELKKKKKSTTCTLVTEPKIDIHMEEQQPIKLWSNSSSLLQALISADWHFFLQRSREGRGERRRWRGEHKKSLPYSTRFSGLLHSSQTIYARNSCIRIWPFTRPFLWLRQCLRSITANQGPGAVMPTAWLWAAYSTWEKREKSSKPTHFQKSQSSQFTSLVQFNVHKHTFPYNLTC